MTIKTKLRTFYTPFLILSSFLHAQTSSTDAAHRATQLTFAQTVSKREMGNNLRLFTGAQYIRNGQHAQGYPFFQSDVPLDGALFYDGASYDHIPLQFDLVTGEVVTHDSVNDANISFVREKLPRFTISGHAFLWLPDAADSDASLAPGYYELLVDGAYTLIARHEKKMVYPTTNEEIPKYVASSAYFLQVHNHYVRIEGQRSLLKVLADKKEALKKFIRQNKLDFGKDVSHALVETIHYYTQLKN